MSVSFGDRAVGRLVREHVEEHNYRNKILYIKLEPEVNHS